MYDPILNPVQIDLHPGNGVARVLGALNGRPCDIPVDALEELKAANRRLTDNPGPEIEATLRRQAILLEGVQIAFFRKSADAKLPDHQAALAGVALKAQRALMGVLGALRTLDEARRDAQALDGGHNDGETHR
jgi:hypothetical protein